MIGHDNRKESDIPQVYRPEFSATLEGPHQISGEHTRRDKDIVEPLVTRTGWHCRRLDGSVGEHHSSDPDQYLLHIRVQNYAATQARAPHPHPHRRETLGSIPVSSLGIDATHGGSLTRVECERRQGCWVGGCSPLPRTEVGWSCYCEVSGLGVVIVSRL